MRIGIITQPRRAPPPAPAGRPGRAPPRPGGCSAALPAARHSAGAFRPAMPPRLLPTVRGWRGIGALQPFWRRRQALRYSVRVLAVAEQAHQRSRLVRNASAPSRVRCCAPDGQVFHRPRSAAGCPKKPDSAAAIGLAGPAGRWRPRAQRRRAGPCAAAPPMVSPAGAWRVHHRFRPTPSRQKVGSTFGPAGESAPSTVTRYRGRRGQRRNQAVGGFAGSGFGIQCSCRDVQLAPGPAGGNPAGGAPRRLRPARQACAEPGEMAFDCAVGGGDRSSAPRAPSNAGSPAACARLRGPRPGRHQLAGVDAAQRGAALVPRKGLCGPCCWRPCRSSNATCPPSPPRPVRLRCGSEPMLLMNAGLSAARNFGTGPM